jgi:hypothetical protein
MTSTSEKALRLPADRRSAVIETELLAWVFEALDSPGQINVLDVGPAMPRTIEFLNSMRCRVHIADLFDSTLIEQQRHWDPEALTDRFAEALWMLDGPLHACLLWDFPNYLATPALEALNRALSPWVTANTRAHAFCAVKRAAPLMQHQYSIGSANEVIQKAIPERPPAEFPHPWRRLVSALNLFDVDRGALRAGGLVEVILRGAAQQSAEPPLRSNEKVEDIPRRPSGNAGQRTPPGRRAGRRTESSLGSSTPRAVGQ